MATTNPTDPKTGDPLGQGSSTGEVPAPARSLEAVALAAGLYGLILLMTVVYEWSLGSLGGIAP